MKVMLLNGSPHEKGCTYTALEEIQRELKKCGVDSEILHVGQEEIHGCIGCRRCAQTGRCVFDDVVNRIGARLDEFDGFIFGTPVYYAGISGQLKSFMDRLFCTSRRPTAPTADRRWTRKRRCCAPCRL